MSRPDLARTLTRLGRRSLAIALFALAGHLLAGAVGAPERIPAPLGFGLLEHVADPGREPLLGVILGFGLLVALLLAASRDELDLRLALEGVGLLLLGGTINLGEEALRGSVRDYLWLVHPELTHGIVFNVADLALLGGFLTIARLPVRAAGELIAAFRRNDVVGSGGA
jgi:hypothetical protein